MSHIVIASRIVNREVSMAGLADILGSSIEVCGLATEQVDLAGK